MIRIYPITQNLAIPDKKRDYTFLWGGSQELFLVFPLLSLSLFPTKGSERMGGDEGNRLIHIQKLICVEHRSAKDRQTVLVHKILRRSEFRVARRATEGKFESEFDLIGNIAARILDQSLG